MSHNKKTHENSRHWRLWLHRLQPGPPINYPKISQGNQRQQTDHAGNAESLRDLEDNSTYTFEQVDICNTEAIKAVFTKHQPDWVMHLAAESHVDRSIDGPGEFIQTNVVGTYTLLQAALEYWRDLPEENESQPSKETFRFLHVSTDEVYGSLSDIDPAFSESTPYDPHSPYSASKAASDHLARTWHDTYGFPVLITNCSNNYGPYQFPEKLIPVVILKCLRGETIPVYGKGENIRDWLYVDDHTEELYSVISKGRIGETYNIGGNNERKNIELVRRLCQLMDEFADSPDYKARISDFRQESRDASASHAGKEAGESYESLMSFVKDRPGHDMRYAIDASKIRDELGWEPREDFESGFRKTVKWYLDNRQWWERILSGDYKLERLGKEQS